MGSSLVNLFNSICYGILALSLFALFAAEMRRVGCVLAEPPRVSVPIALRRSRAEKLRPGGEGEPGSGIGCAGAPPGRAEPRSPPAPSAEIRIYRNGLNRKAEGGEGAGGDWGRECVKSESSLLGLNAGYCLRSGRGRGAGCVCACVCVCREPQALK